MRLLYASDGCFFSASHAMSIVFEAVHQVKIECISIPHFVWKNDPSFLDFTRFISQINNIHVPLLMLCPSSTHSFISFIFPSTVDVSSVCSLIDRTEIKINICTIPTLHPLVSIRSSLLRSVLTIPHPTSPLEQVRSGWLSSVEPLKWGMRHGKGKNHSSRRTSALSSSLVILITALFCVLAVSFLCGIKRKLCSSNSGSRWKREKVKYSIAATNCKLAIDFSINVIKTTSTCTNTPWRSKHNCAVLHSKKDLGLDYFRQHIKNFLWAEQMGQFSK